MTKYRATVELTVIDWNDAEYYIFDEITGENGFVQESIRDIWKRMKLRLGDIKYQSHEIRVEEYPVDSPAIVSQTFVRYTDDENSTFLSREFSYLGAPHNPPKTLPQNR